MTNSQIVAHNLAAALLSGEWARLSLLARVAQACGGKERWQRRFVSQLLIACPQHPGNRAYDKLAKWIAGGRGFGSVSERLHQVFWLTPAMAPVNAIAASWQAPAISTSTALAEWLELQPNELDWFADCHGHATKVKSERLRHYTYHWLKQRPGKWRLLEMPKPQLKHIQRRVLQEILDRVPPHPAAHGYRTGHSIATFAAPHCGQRTVVRFDLRHFFASVPSSRVHALFTAAGYPPTVARLLTGVCTNRVPDHVWQAYPGVQYASLSDDDHNRFRVAHLPQGAPTSPSLANLCAYRMDRRLQGLAASVGARYTRYADDLAFSGDRELERMGKRFQILVCRIALEEGFEMNLRKSRFMRQGVRQQLVGIVVNRHLNFRRDDYDQLKAILHNCARFGPASQNRQNHDDFRSHLMGRIAHVNMLNATRGRKLLELFQRVQWQNSAKT